MQKFDRVCSKFRRYHFSIFAKKKIKTKNKLTKEKEKMNNKSVLKLTVPIV